ncbi:MAG: serine/threonine-protein kinase, partial [Bryobacteraceae bacterium]
MPLSVGTKLGPYEILAPIGAGGMGEVYRAKDSKLDREVAIKILPDALTHDPERLARFEREAKVLASLNHSHVAQIYAVEQGALVMELVEGETLRGPLPIETALNYAKQIAEALEAAHEKGIIHRDLKPANIMITSAGEVKVLDFGLARTANEPLSDPQNSPTLTMSPTHAGMILGTAAYMAPEQARGKTVDKRADIWAFGCVVYEMLTGKQLFHGENVSDILAAVLKEEPDLDRVPAKVRRLLERCLEKDPKKRLRDIGDWALLLDEAKSLKAARPLLWIAAVSALVLALAVLGLVHFREGPPSVAPNIELTIVPPRGSPLRPVGGLISPPEISPDGSAVLYFAGAEGLFVRRLDSLEPKLVPGSQAAGSPPFWSADSRTVVYQRSDRTWVKVRVPGGAPETVMPSDPSRGGSWGDTGDILVGVGQNLELLPASGKSVYLDIPALKQGYYSYPEFLPGGTDFLFRFTPQNGEGSATYLATLRQARATEPVLLLKSDTAAHYTPAGGGRLLFVRGDNLYAQRLD